MEPRELILKAAAIVGSQTRLAELVDVSQQTVSAWIKRNSIAAENCPAIERATGGQITCEMLRPDMADDWNYLRGTRRRVAKQEIVGMAA